VIDLHTHLLPDLDDGARDLSEAVAIARSMAADGVRTAAATPHVRDDWPTTAEAMENPLAVVREAVRQATIELDILPGGEFALDQLVELDVSERSRFGLGGNAQLVLVSFRTRVGP
jgi:protein-tyrosine phosphatase